MTRRIQEFLFAVALLSASPTFAKEATINGRIVLTNGAPAAGAEIIVKDSWAGIFTMRERELLRSKANEKGEFSLPPIKFRHTINILVLGKACEWFTGTDNLKERDRTHDRDYEMTILLLHDSCSAGVQPNKSFKPRPLRGSA